MNRNTRYHRSRSAGGAGTAATIRSGCGGRAAARWTLIAATLAGVGFAARGHAVDLVGYVPAYRMGDVAYVQNVLPAQLALLDEVRYFGVTVTAAGGLTTTAADLNNLAVIKTAIDALPAGDRPRLGITLGGANASANFPAVAADPARRTALAQSLDALLDQTGAVGVDFDWEHPSDGVQLTTHYPALLAAAKQELGAERRVYATVSPEKILPRSVLVGASAIDGVSIMTYDIGWWANDPADPNLNQHSLPEYVEDAVDAWTNPVGAAIPRTWVFGAKRSVDAPEAKLGVGDPFYARGYNGSSQDLAVPYRSLASLASADGNAYMYQGSNVWLPGPDLVAQRIEFARQRGLQHVIFWEMWHDLPPSDPRSLLRAAFDARAALAAGAGDFDGDGVADGADLSLWQLHFGAAAGATPAQGDADRDGDVDGADLLVWQRFAVGPPPGAAPVPEGATWLWILSGLGRLRLRTP